MDNMEIIREFIITAKAIHKLCTMDAASEGYEVPDSVTVGSTYNGVEKIEITITIKETDDERES